MRPAPIADCPRCPRLVAYRAALRSSHPDWHNAPVPSFGPPDARLLVVGLAPGRAGANRTGRPFTGDYAGALLYAALLRHGLARGRYEARCDDGLELVDCRITNAVRCVPPANRPLPSELAACRAFLVGELEAPPRPEVILVLGRVAHAAVVAALGLRPGAHRFAHGTRQVLPDGRLLLASYHSSRYNVATGRLTPPMLEAVVAEAVRVLAERRSDGESRRRESA
ncbi:MAG: uracil-DNA glycosylase [Geminicoccaceae bacterium]|nr:uracil-DNA glycosylase [Geminicoccaceae bacterium]MCX8099791.1 uracil-DNA glycosylase [Geminicoccaceae bacterium]